MTNSGSYQIWFTTTGIAGYAETGTSLHYNESISYAGNLSVEGPVYTEDVTFDGFTAKDIRVMGVHSPNYIDAIVGMGYWTESNTGTAGFFETLIKQKSVSTTEFGYYLGRKNTSEESSLTLGGHDSTKHTGHLVSVPVIKQGFWSINIDGYSVHGKMLNSTTPVGLLSQSCFS